MISKNLFPIIIFIYFFQYVSERNLDYFNFQKVSKKNVSMHHPYIKKSLTSTTMYLYLGPAFQSGVFFSNFIQLDGIEYVLTTQPQGAKPDKNL